MTKVRITARVVAATKPVPGKVVKITASYPPGFTLLVYPSGKKAFALRYGRGKLRKMIVLGAHGELTPNSAEKKAMALLERVSGGGDPKEDRDARRSIPIFREWVKDYSEEIEGRLSPAWIRETKRFLAIACETFGSKPVDKITVDDVARFFKAQRVLGITTGNRSLAALRACLSSAWRRQLIADNPAAKVRAGRENPPKARVLTDDEMARLVKTLENHKDSLIRAAFTLLIEVGVRRSEVLRAKWEDFDFEERIWRLPRPKSCRPEVVPLTDDLVAMLQGLSRPGPYLLPGRKPDEPRRTLQRPWREIKKAAGLPGDLTPHDLRRSFGLAVARTAGLHVASKLLRHSDIRVTERVYAPLGLASLREEVEKVTKERKRRILKVVNGGKDTGEEPGA